MFGLKASGPFVQEERARESRLELALLRVVIDAVRPNRLLLPVFAAAICLIFSTTASFGALTLWFGLAMLALLPQTLVARCMPAGILPPQQARNWIVTATAANLIHTIAWTSMAWVLWAPGNEFNHLLIELVLAISLTTEAGLVGPSSAVAIPTLLCYGLVMTLAPLQAPEKVFHYLAAVTPIYVGYVGLVARQHHVRARAALMLAEERNALLAELVCAKLESDRGREKAEAASLAKSQFLANMSHELRTPLNAIIGFSELIATRIFAAEPERNYDYAKMIHGSGMHLLTLINDILDLAKIEAGRWKLEEQELDLARTACEVMQLVAAKAEGGGVSVENAVPAELPFLFADARAVRQVLINLLSNAVKFTPEGGKVRIFAEMDGFGDLEFGVSDTGIGIAPEDMSRIFDSFGQGKYDVTIADKGTGLGLAIVKGLAEAHGGSVALDSDVGRGTIVTITLPGRRLRARQSFSRSKVA